MCSASSARRTCSAPRSASEKTAMLRMFISRSARMMRTAISPRLAIRTFPNMHGDFSKGTVIPPAVVAHALLRAAFTVQTGRILYKTYRADGRHFHEDKGGDNDALESEQCAETASTV